MFPCAAPGWSDSDRKLPARRGPGAEPPGRGDPRRLRTGQSEPSRTERPGGRTDGLLPPPGSAVPGSRRRAGEQLFPRARDRPARGAGAAPAAVAPPLRVRLHPPSPFIDALSEPLCAPSADHSLVNATLVLLILFIHSPHPFFGNRPPPADPLPAGCCSPSWGSCPAPSSPALPRRRGAGPPRGRWLEGADAAAGLPLLGRGRAPGCRASPRRRRCGEAADGKGRAAAWPRAAGRLSAAGSGQVAVPARRAPPVGEASGVVA